MREEFKGTKNDWNVVKSNKGTFDLCESYTIETEDIILAVVTDEYCGEMTSKEVEANATLISLAPQMLEFIQKFKSIECHNLDLVDLADSILEEVLGEVKEEKTIPFTYAALRRKLDWEKFCDITGISYYAKNAGHEFRDSEVFNIRTSVADKYSL